ncbi:E3 binding domain-containing protein [Nocardia sp. NPDC052566]|uniref:E3 binding domain-containing protein n=1 Tax=Nocardia sp. NPDC052566 TaxID=3364330 RepID=UPI0037CA3CD9
MIQHETGPRTFASPLARRMASDAGLPLAQLTGTGPAGRVVRRDVAEATTLHNSTAQLAGTGPAGGMVRRDVAEAIGLWDSAAQLPGTGPAGGMVRRDVADATALRNPAHADVAEGQASPTVRPTSPTAHLAAPTVQLRRAVRVDPLIALCEQLSEPGAPRISMEDLLVRASVRTHAVVPGLDDGGFGVLHLGDYDVEEVAGLGGHGRTAVLGLGTARPEAVVVDGALDIATVVRCTLTVDATVVDVVLAARWLSAYVTRVEYPARILT